MFSEQLYTNYSQFPNQYITGIETKPLNCKGYTVYVTRPINPSSNVHAAVTNSCAASIACIRGKQAALARENLTLTIITKVLALHLVTVWYNKVKTYKRYFLVCIPTVINLRR